MRFSRECLSMCVSVCLSVVCLSACLCVCVYLSVCLCASFPFGFKGWSGGAMVLGKLPVPGRPTIWITVGQGPTALSVGAKCSRCG